MVRKHIYFTGTVQGVGFRFRAQMNAQKYGCTGWVKNLYDGRVECEIQGELIDIQHFILDMRHEPWIEIERVEMTDLPVKKEKGFQARYY